VNWDSSNSWKNDTTAFLFSLDYATRYPVYSNGVNAIYCNPDHGPTFGNGHSLFISDNSNISGSSYARSDNNY